jgi:hypothetical protein
VNSRIGIKTETVIITIVTMDDPVRALTALKRRKEVARRKIVAKELIDSLFSGAVTRLHKVKEENGGRLPFGKMSEAIQGLCDIGVHTTRNVLNKLLQKYVKPSITVNEDEARPPLSAIDVNEQSNISSLHGVEGAENLCQKKKGGRPKGSTKVNAAKENN